MNSADAVRLAQQFNQFAPGSERAVANWTTEPDQSYIDILDDAGEGDGRVTRVERITDAAKMRDLIVSNQ